jgi:predicted RNA-binding protein with PUA-like domain
MTAQACREAQGLRAAPPRPIRYAAPMVATRYWLVKSEPAVFSIDDLKRDGTTSWEGVRNYQARNFMRDEMTTGDLVLFYHSNADPPGVAGIARVCRAAYSDHTQFDRKSAYFDPKSTEEDPCWLMVDLEFIEKFPALVTMNELKSDPKLDGLVVAKRGQRLSIQPVEKRHFEVIRKLGRSKCKPRSSSRKAAKR